MKAVKKMIAILMILAIILCTAACGASESIQATTGSGTKETGTTAAPGPKKVQAADLLEAFTAGTVADKATDEAFTAAAFDWAARLFSQVYAQEKEQKTLLVSPLSVLIALAMTANGAKGETLLEMEKTLGGSLSIDDLNAYLRTYLKSLPSAELAKFAFANAVWFKDDPEFLVEDEFLQKVVDYYDAAVRKAPFDASTVQEINQWVAQHTDDMIDKLLTELEDDDRMVLVNALVFDAKWDVPFAEAYCRPGPFTGLDGKDDEATFMNGTVHSYLESEEAIGFTKSYEGDGYRFVALLPKDENGFEAFVQSLTGEKLAALLGSEAPDKTLITIPKFSYDYDTSLVGTLKALGMPTAFGPDADLSGISTSEALHISDVLHKTHIEVDSEGTKAAAVTTVTVAATTALGPEPHKVYLDRPFVYMIVDTATNLPVFMGTVTGFGE